MRATVVYFSGCAANYVDPDVGRAAVRVLERNSLVVSYPRQRCCGMPQLAHGKLKGAEDRARFNVASLARAPGDIVTACTSCALMLKHYYPRLLGTAEAEAVSSRTYDLGEYLVLLQEKGLLDTDFQAISGTFLYHAPCHLKSLGAGLVERRLRLLGQIPGISIAQVDRGCCGFAGGFGVIRQNRALSLQIGTGLLEALRQTTGCRAVTECPGCKLQIEGEAGIPVIHPVQLLQQAYCL